MGGHSTAGNGNLRFLLIHGIYRLMLCVVFWGGRRVFRPFLDGIDDEGMGLLDCLIGECYPERVIRIDCGNGDLVLWNLRFHGQGSPVFAEKAWRSPFGVETSSPFTSPQNLGLSPRRARFLGQGCSVSEGKERCSPLGAIS
jgi:hypothetical protein